MSFVLLWCSNTVYIGNKLLLCGLEPRGREPLLDHAPSAAHLARELPPARFRGGQREGEQPRKLVHLAPQSVFICGEREQTQVRKTSKNKKFLA